MNSRERAKKAIHFGAPDRPPVSHAVLPAAQLKYGAALNEILAEFREDFGWDYMTDLPVEKYPALYKAGRNRDAFGTVWHVEWPGICGIPVEWPITELEHYENYQWPEDFTAGPPVGRQYSGHMCGFDERWYARGAWITFFEQFQQLRGMENFLPRSCVTWRPCEKRACLVAERRRPGQCHQTGHPSHRGQRQKRSGGRIPRFPLTHRMKRPAPSQNPM